MVADSDAASSLNLSPTFSFCFPPHGLAVVLTFFLKRESPSGGLSLFTQPASSTLPPTCLALQLSGAAWRRRKRRRGSGCLKPCEGRGDGLLHLHHLPNVINVGQYSAPWKTWALSIGIIGLLKSKMIKETMWETSPASTTLPSVRRPPLLS
ncbi:uncharacterized protein LOC123517637 isoform X1 [Portunus trituberculatus]|uniref:uncharacterized protein LOC123517637 isoform X1 n=1 Tax=Portunus trituberculatus TaxID=210409 RepID=UPI001E1CD93B|nr:uncharacterized protein LOC123517637 isoform X1 [Portunus trituberculatus]